MLSTDDYIELQTIEINSSQQLFGFSESCGNQKYVGLDAIVVALENSENVTINDYILTDGNCDPQTPDCTDLEQQQQQDYIDALKAENKVADDFEYPMYLIRVMLCDGSEVYLTITELQNLPGTYIELQRIFIENEEQTFQVGSTISSVDMEDLFYLSLHYDDQDASIGNAIQKNGNISYMTWQTKGMNEQIYKFEYDVLNRINLATFGERTAGSLDFNNLYGASFENYDANGNIGKITRYGPTITQQSGNTTYGCKTLIDDLTLSYNGNQINTVMDVVSDANNRLRGFKASTSSALSYGYDANGNLVNDPHKGLTVSYNHLNLPEYFNFGNGDAIDILYDAEGRKLQKAVSGNILAEKDYCQEIEYGDKSLEAIYTNVGRVVRSGGNWDFEYFLKDHLQSVRVVFREGVNGLELLQENHNYPFGAPMEGKWSLIQPTVNQDYLYNSKERNQDYGLGWLSFKNRWMLDGWLPVFSGIDPISADFPHLSPYNYSDNSPIANVDLHGLQAMSFGLALQAAQKRKEGGQAAVDEHRASVQKGTGAAIATASVFTPGPEDGVMALAGATRFGGTLLKTMSNFAGKTYDKMKSFFKGGDKIDDIDVPSFMTKGEFKEMKAAGENLKNVLSEDKKENIINSIIEGYTDDAFKKLLKIDLDDKTKATLTKLSKELEKNKNERLSDLKSLDEYRQKRNQINYQLIRIVNPE